MYWVIRIEIQINMMTDEFLIRRHRNLIQKDTSIDNNLNTFGDFINIHIYIYIHT